MAAGLALVPLLITLSDGAALPSAEPSTTEHHDIPVVIVISADTLRADRLSCYRRERAVATPGIDALADDGILFERSTSAAPWTLPSLASIMTGLSPSVHSVVDVDSRLPDSVTTLAESMQRAGYHTGAIVLNDLLHPKSNLVQGFDDYNFLTFPSYGRSIGRRALETVFPMHFPVPAWPTTDDVTARTLRWIEENRDRDFFLWVHYYDPHAPFTPPARYLPDANPPPRLGPRFVSQRAVLSGIEIPSRSERAWIEVLYSAEVKYLDDNVARLLEGLKVRGLYDRALVVFTSDHGEEFWEHGAQGHGHTLYQELLSVPLIVKLPGSSIRGRVAMRVSTESLMPTILDLCGLSFDSERFSSTSVKPWLRSDGGHRSPKAIVGSAQVLFDHRQTVLFEEFKYIRSLIGDEEELFDLGADPGERHSLARTERGVVDRARRLLEAHEQTSKRLREHLGIVRGERVDFDEETFERLKALGYVR